MVPRIFVFVVSLLLASVATAAAARFGPQQRDSVTQIPSRRMTNAERLASGLPLNKPSRRYGALRARTSSTPPPPPPPPTPPTPPTCDASITYTAHTIAVDIDGNGSIDGYISEYPGSSGTSVVGYQGQGTAAHVSFTTCQSPDVAFDMSYRLRSQSYTDLGAVQAPSGSVLAYIAYVNHSPSYAPAAVVGNGYNVASPSESTIWKFDPDTNQFTLQWVDSAGFWSDVAVVLTPDSLLGFVSDAGSYLAANPSAHLVLLSLASG